jgi:predicted O-methyltransferase YrrM
MQTYQNTGSPPPQARHTEPSWLCSLDDDVGPSPALVTLALDAARLALTGQINLPEHSEDYSDRVWANLWPGEHYRLLRGIVMLLNPQVIVEVGTSSGLGTYTLARAQSEGETHTFDLLPWHQFSSYLTQEFIESQNITQHLADLQDPAVFEVYRDLLTSAHLIFCDGPKDRVFEPNFLQLLTTLKPTGQPRLLVMDDIRFDHMCTTWRSIKSPKLDITSFGHWSGTGLVDITRGLILG